MNLRQAAYFALCGLRGQALGTCYKRILREDQEGIPPDTTKKLLVQLLTHCKQSVPYYARVMHNMGDSFYENPKEYLRRFPILTKDILRNRFDDLKSTDLTRRKWYFSASGGSTGEPVKFIQDWESAARSGAVSLLYSKLAGREIGESEVNLWGSARDITESTEHWRARFINKLSNTIILNTFYMTPSRMREFIRILNATRPKLITAYAESIYELARFAEREGLEVAPQAAIISSAGTLYPSMREKIEQVFQCRVFNRYGSREVGDIACERPGCEGLWVAPWGHYVEIVDSAGNRVPDDTEGEILVTCLTNYAMPFIRYKIGDLGIWADQTCQPGRKGPLLKNISGRLTDCFFKKDGSIITPEFFIHMVGVVLNTGWIRKYQVIQEAHDLVHVVIALADPVDSPDEHFKQELLEISRVIRLVMGQDCRAEYTFVTDIPPTPSGKFRYTISRVTR